MSKLKLTKGELKRQRDALRQYERYLPTLQLKKQQLQMEILNQAGYLLERESSLEKKIQAALIWAGLLKEADYGIKQFITPGKVSTSLKNIAGVNIPVFERIDWPEEDYDLFLTPMWLDAVVESLRSIVTLKNNINILLQGVKILKQELRVTTQRVNLFEKVKIPQAKEAIRVIKIYLGDQMANAVGRSKIAKDKIEQDILEEVAA